MDAFTMHTDRPFHDSPTDTPSQRSAVERTTEGRLRRNDLTSTDRTVAVLGHLWWLLLLTPAGIVGVAVPIVLWLTYRGRNHFLSDHGQEATNFVVSLLVLHIALGVTIVGIAFWPVLWIYALVGIVRAAIAAGSGEYFRYPITIRLL